MTGEVYHIAMMLQSNC